MRRTVFLAAMSLICVLGVSAQQHNIDTQKSTLTIHVGKTGAFSGLGHEHEVRAPIHSGTADTGSHPAVEMHVDARARSRRAWGLGVMLVENMGGGGGGGGEKKKEHSEKRPPKREKDDAGAGS